MGLLKKLKNSTQRAKGRAKERAGRESRDPYLEAEGRKDRVAGGVKQVGEKAKDTAREIRRTGER
ncbi:CsbD family protein [Actinomadura syzygii]|uniref:CsbD family protein n=1 Tax=Actinomadura syzygii TaxID=1427538 RepID=A0A5D0UBG9_9ACTN|nr:CsbD family protein [Actinomadura syzygii]TYC08082.1 CsbD family protein [Actinomadura syzygii]TYC15891.1 CsbD family protein [Actinomadura syzygii]